MPCWLGSFPCMVYNDSSHHETLDYEFQLFIAVIS
jgi:hypothetical protein